MSAPPSGTVTFLFTDIEGSTRLWEEHPELMAVVLARHDALLHEVISRNEGQVFKTVGDAFCAAFADPARALAAGVAAHQVLQAEPWPAPIIIKVRIAAHTGHAERRDDDYFGRTLNRAARLSAAAHGGQFLLSGSTQQLVRDALGQGIDVLELGTHRLKDLVNPERVFQVVAPGLEREFPPLHTLEGHANNLPTLLDEFIGREKETADIVGKLRGNRLVTLTGVGGSGKTRLALQVGAELVGEVTDGIWFVELAPVAEPANVMPAIASAIRVREAPGGELRAAVRDHLAQSAPVVILDNCEHLVEAVADVAEFLTRGCPRLRILATSREALGVPGEAVVRVPPLATPAASHGLTAKVASSFEAVELFVDRARLIEPEFRLTDGNAADLAEICHQLDGIPLAIELAAARCHTLSVPELKTRLSDRFRLLVSGSRTAIPRQKTLRALIDWSYDLLSDEEKRLFCALSVFAGGWSLSTAESVCSDPEDDDDVLELISSLVSKSLLVADGNRKITRFHMLETVREYAASRFDEHEFAARVRSRHTDTFVNLASSAMKHFHSPDQLEWLDRLELDHGNLRLALHALTEEEAPGGRGLQMCVDLYRFWWIRGHWAEARSWHERILARTQHLRTLTRAAALTTYGSICLSQGDYSQAIASYDEGLELSREIGSDEQVATSLHNLAHAAHLRGNYLDAKPLYEESLAIRRRLGNKDAITGSLNNLANVHQALRNYEAARSLHQECLAIRREAGVSQGISQTLQNLACLEAATGDYSNALPLFLEALGLMESLRDIRSIGEVFDGIAEIHLAMDRPEDAVTLWGAAESVRASIGAPLHDLVRDRQRSAYSAVRDRIGAAAFDRAWQDGQSLSLEEACSLARRCSSYERHDG